MFKKLLPLVAAVALCQIGFSAQKPVKKTENKPFLHDVPKNQQDLLDKKNESEAVVKKTPFIISLYNPTYFMPVYYNPNRNSVYHGRTPEGQKLQAIEFKFQFSVKVPIISDIFSPKNSLFLAYTQQSYWQAYNESAFFRETNYMPELFFSHQFNKVLGNSGVQLNTLNVGIVHQSNGEGGFLERSWNRIYANMIMSSGNFYLSIKPWVIITDESLKRYNSDISRYLGHGRFIIAYTFGDHGPTISLMSRNNLESGFKRGGVEVTFSTPINSKLRLYTQAFYGYGQSLIDYNHKTTSVGIGVSLNDWV